MNIFYLDTDINNCAAYMCNSHIVKMPTEFAQLLSVAMDHVGEVPPFKVTHKSHPCAIWARQSIENYQWLFDLAAASGKEYTRRYGKVHRSAKLLGVKIPRDLKLPSNGFLTEPPNCTTIKNTKHSLVDIYRMYYLTDKAHLLRYTNRQEPQWMGDRFYQQQIQTLGKVTKPANPTKADIAQALGIEGLKALTIADLEKLKKHPSASVEMTLPTGRRKQPYLEEVAKIDPTISWAKLTIATISRVINMYMLEE